MIEKHRQAIQVRADNFFKSHHKRVYNITFKHENK